ncbi:PAS domain S-box protein [Haloarcula sp. Atlit-7R]|uniref:PAS domain S-box protein n=1 Tax=Haloarcula sp. Atlit-7R TaxID=2282125 RepID=UPI0013145374|nr:PAS domain S-box protein [Haloarcula sp. Atlit-7R]
MDEGQATAPLESTYVTNTSGTTITTSSAAAGLQQLDSHTNSIHAVVISTQLPEMPSEELLSQIRERRPEIPIIFILDSQYTHGITQTISTGCTDYGYQGEVAASKERWAGRLHNYARRYRAEREADTTKSRLELAAQASSDVIWEREVGADVVSVSGGFNETFGYEREGSIQFEWWINKIHPDDRERINSDLEQTIANQEQQVESQYRFQRADGSYAYVKDQGRIVYNESGDPTRLVGAISDITTRKTQREELERRSEAIEAVVDGIAILDESDKYQYMNAAHAELYGYDEPADLIGESWRELYQDQEIEWFESTILPEVRETSSWRGEAVGTRCTGETFPQTVSLTKLADDGLVCIVRDISEQKERERELSEQRAFIESLLNALPDIFYVLDRNGEFVEWNDRVPEILGYTDQELAGMAAVDLVPNDNISIIMDLMSNIFTEQVQEQRESELITRSGERIPYQLNGAPLVDEENNVTGLVGTGRNISERVLREERLDVVSRVLRHNLRNDMNSILGHAQVVADNETGSTVQQSVDHIIDTARALSSLAENANRIERALSDNPQQQPVNLEDAVDTAVDNLEETETAADIAVDIPEEKWIHAIDDVTAAITEALENSIQHTTQSSTQIRIVADIDSTGEWVTLRIADSGDMIPPEERRVLVDGENPLEHGSGLGLWLINWVVVASGGELRFAESDLGGSEVQMQFQRCDQPPSPFPNE